MYKAAGFMYRIWSVSSLLVQYRSDTDPSGSLKAKSDLIAIAIEPAPGPVQLLRTLTAPMALQNLQ